MGFSSRGGRLAVVCLTLVVEAAPARGALVDIAIGVIPPLASLADNGYLFAALLAF